MIAKLDLTAKDCWNRRVEKDDGEKGFAEMVSELYGTDEKHGFLAIDEVD